MAKNVPFNVLMWHALSSEAAAARNGLPGLELAHFVRELVLEEIARGHGPVQDQVRRMVHPVSGLRYLEFSHVGEALSVLLGKEGVLGKAILDVSSPWQFPFWFALRQGAEVTMVNPDDRDLAQSRMFAGRLGIPGLRFSGSSVGDLVAAGCRYDLVTSVSVIEHAEDDLQLVEQMSAALVSGGYLVLTFPVRPSYAEEYRPERAYPTQRKTDGRGWFFFQRFYDNERIDRLITRSGCVEVFRRYCWENQDGWFDWYVREWRRKGILFVVNDAAMFSRSFEFATNKPRESGFGNCCLVLKKQ